MSDVFPPFRQRFLARICMYDYFLYILLSFQIVLFLFTSVSHFTVNLPPETQAIVYLNFILLGGLMLLTGGIIYICKRYETADKLI